MATAMENLVREVSETKGVIASAKALMNSLATRLRSNAGDPAAIQALADELDAEQAALAQAITDNTVLDAGSGSTPAPGGGEV